MSSWHTSQLSYALGLGGLFSFYGVVSVGVFFLGPQLGYSFAYQVVTVALVLLTLPFALIIGFVASRRAKKAAQKAEEEAKAKEEAGGGDGEKPEKLSKPAQNQEISGGAEEAFKFLQESQLGGTKGKEAVYALPFYIFAGMPQSGKSSIALASGLNFQNLPSQRQSEQQFIRPTQSIDWRVTSEAVILDTAGRFQLEGTDAEDWSATLEVLKKQRSKRPLDGLVLVVDSAKIVADDEAEIEQYAKVLRTRIDEAMQRIKLRFPIYLVFTHADSIEGFRDSFSNSMQEGKKYVWGATFPLEKTATAHSLFDGEFDALYEALMKRRLLRLSAPFPPVRQLRIFNFPLHFNATRRKLGHFVNVLFRPNPFSENPMFRGFYFVANLAGANSRGQATALESINESYFTERFVKDVLLRDRDLVATFEAQKVKPPVLGWILMAIGAFIATILLLGAGISLYNNSKLLNEATERGETVLNNIKLDKGKDLKTKTEAETRRELDAVNNLRETLVKLDKFDREGVPLSYGFGLYSGHKLYRERLLPAYFIAIEERFKEPVVKQIETDLRTFAASNTAVSANPTEEQEQFLGKNYNLLKAYLMLSGDYKDKADPNELIAQLEPYWVKAAPEAAKEVSKNQLEFWAKQIDREDSPDRTAKGFPRIALDKPLVDAARDKLKNYPARLRYYSRVINEINKELDDKAVTVESILATQGFGQLTGTHTVPPSFTIDGYQKIKVKFDTEALAELGKVDWVMGESLTEKVNTTQDDIRILKERYQREYVDHWRKLIASTNVKPVKTKEDLREALDRFSLDNSPMVILMKEIARQTKLSVTPQSGGIWGTIKSLIPPNWLPMQQQKPAGDTDVEKQFKPLFDFVGGSGDSPPITKYGAAIKVVKDKVLTDGSTITDDFVKKVTDGMAKEEDPIKLSESERKINDMLQAFTSTAAIDIAGLLKKPLSNVKSFFGSGLQQQIDKTWRDTILAEAQSIEKGFPFTSDGEADLAKITAFLNPSNGKLTKFYKDSLEKYFEQKDKILVEKAESEVKFTPEFVAYLNNAFNLRKGLYGENSATPEFKYSIKMNKVEGALVDVKIDGQTIGSEGSSTFSFPAPGGATSGVEIQLTGTGSTISTAPAATPTASPTPGTTGSTTTANSAPANVSRFQTTPKPSNANSSSSSSAGDASGSIREQGTWGLFKLFEKAGNPPKNASGEYVLNFKLGGKPVQLIIKPIGEVDLFDRKVFTSLKAPQTIVKQVN